MTSKTLILASGLQSGGTTLISHAFLKHPDLDGILDMASDRIEMNFTRVSSPLVWVKMTSSSFRWHEVAAVYAMQGFKVEPLLIVRNPFDAWVSLKDKWYGLNSSTAEDPPLALRFLRFYEDWQRFNGLNWPIVKFEDFLKHPESILKSACDGLSLDYHQAMCEPVDNIAGIAYVSESNASFVANLASGPNQRVASKNGELTQAEYDWISHHLAPLIHHFGYTNRHRVTDGNDLLPNPFDNRRYFGFHAAADARGVASKLPQLLALCKNKQAAGIPIVIYGAGDFGEYLADQVTAAGVVIDSFVDSNAKDGSKVGSLTVYKPNNTDHKQAPFYIIASFQHAQEMIGYLVGELSVPMRNIFKFV